MTRPPRRSLVPIMPQVMAAVVAGDMVLLDTGLGVSIGVPTERGPVVVARPRMPFPTKPEDEPC